METVLLSIKPNSKSKATTTDGFEFKYMVSGDCDYYIQDEKISLHEGDSLYFDASKPHYPLNTTKRKVIMLVFYFLTVKWQINVSRRKKKENEEIWFSK